VARRPPNGSGATPVTLESCGMTSVNGPLVSKVDMIKLSRDPHDRGVTMFHRHIHREIRPVATGAGV
jgi:hypothetical protein